MPLLRLRNRPVAYTVLTSRKATRSRIRVSPQGVQVVIPAAAGPHRAADFLKENQTWVLDQLDFVSRAGNLRMAPRSRSTILLRGVDTKIRVIEEQTTRRYGIVEAASGLLLVRVPQGLTTEAPRALQAWLRRQARADLVAALDPRARQMRRRFGRLYVMAQRTKWGGCSRKKNLSFTWRLVMAPPEVLDYIVVHELAHLAEPYHSTKFWLIVRSFCPDFERHKAWLRDNEWRLRIPSP